MVNMGGRLGYSTFKNVVLGISSFGTAVQIITEKRNLSHVYLPPVPDPNPVLSE